jgi:restriction endonuclease Mrr
VICSQTGEIVYWSAETGIDGHTKVDPDDLDPELIRIRPLPSWVWYEDMEEFARGITDDRAGRSLARAIHATNSAR